MGTFKNCIVILTVILETTDLSLTKINENRFSLEMLNIQNYYRAIHEADELELNQILSNDAMECLESWLRMATNVVPDNLNFITDTYYTFYVEDTKQDETVESVYLTWYNEGKDYNYLNEPKNFENGNFTQVIWKDTKYLGLAFLKLHGKTWVVASYHPSGNKEGEYFRNVLPPKVISDASTSN